MPMMSDRYQVIDIDASSEGMERLRNHDEFILLAYADADSSNSSVREQWLDDIQSCARPDGFDYTAAVDAVYAVMSSEIQTIIEQLPVNATSRVAKVLELLAPLDISDELTEALEALTEGEDGDVSFPVRLYIRDTKGGDAN